MTINRNCNGCTACCYSYSIPDFKHNKTFCKYLKDTPPTFTMRSDVKEEWKNYNSNCSIYNDKPPMCNAFKCDWLLGYGEEKDIPKLSGLIFDSNRVTELWDGALNKDLITKMSNQTGKKYKIVRKRFIIPMLQDK